MISAVVPFASFRTSTFPDAPISKPVFEGVIVSISN